MFPWEPGDFHKVLGFSSIVAMIAEKALLDKNTVRAFIRQERRLRASTIKECGLEQIQELFDQTSLKISDDEGKVRPYSGFFKLILKVSEDACGAGLSLPGDFGDRISCFGRTIYAILWTESVYFDVCEGKADRSALFGPNGPFSSFAAGMAGKQPTEDFDLKRDTYYLHQHHALMFFLAALDLDIDIKPERFFPLKIDTLHHPMYFFVHSLRRFAEAGSWAELARIVGNLSDKDGGDTEFQIRRWANAPTLEHCWSWERLNKLLDRLDVRPLGNPENGGDQRRRDILWDYALTRILQKHFNLIYPSLNRAGIADEGLRPFYNSRFKACKENECRRIPLHP